MNQGNPIRFGEYKVLRRIGTGGFGAVYLAENSLFPDHLFAVKAFNRLEDESEASSNFLDELNNVIGLSHTNIVQVRGFGMETLEDAKQPYIVMDFIEGPTGGSYNLKQHIRTRGGKISPTEVKGLFKQILSAMAVVHDKRIAHLDLKPENVLLDSDFNAYVSDFGVSRTVSSKSIHLKDGPNIQGFSPYYASPEQIRHAYGSRHSDIFSLGVMLMECLTGTRPEVLHSKTHPRVDYAPPSTGGLRREWDELLERCLSIDPAYRFPNASVLLRALQRVPTQAPEEGLLTQAVSEEPSPQPVHVPSKTSRPPTQAEGAQSEEDPGFTGSIARLLEISERDHRDEEEPQEPEESKPGKARKVLVGVGAGAGLVGGGLGGLVLGDLLGNRFSGQIGSLATFIVGSQVGPWIGVEVGKTLGALGVGGVGALLGALLAVAVGRGLDRLRGSNQDSTEDE